MFDGVFDVCLSAVNLALGLMANDPVRCLLSLISHSRFSLDLLFIRFDLSDCPDCSSVIAFSLMYSVGGG